MTSVNKLNNVNDNFFENKNKISYSKMLNDEIRLLSFNAEDSSLIGSASYKIQKYPADIDLFEKVLTCCSKKDAIEYFTEGIKAIAHDVTNKRDHWLVDIKCGIDFRYDIELTSRAIHKFLKESPMLLNNEDFEEISVLVDEIDLYKNFDTKLVDTNYEKIYDILRKYKIVRWGACEVQAGVQYRFGKRFEFKECVDTHSPINIEIIAVINGKFTDLSNFFVLVFHDKITGQDVVVNFPDDYIIKGKMFVIEGLREGINKVLFSNTQRDVFKGIKRMYSLARLTNDGELLNKIYKAVVGDLASLSQMKSELGTIIKILKFTSYLPKDILFNQLDDIKWRMGGNMNLTDNNIIAYSNIILDVLNNKENTPHIIEQLKGLYDSLLRDINIAATKYLKTVGLYHKF